MSQAPDHEGRDTALIEDKTAESRLNRVRKLLAKAEAIQQMKEPDAGLLREAEALNERAAQLIAQYGIDRAMLAAQGREADTVTDRVLFIDRPFADEMLQMLWNIALALGAKGRSIKTWDDQAGPKARGGVPRGGWKYGLRLFAHGSDMERIELLYTSARNQALAGAKRIVNRETEFGQAQKADRVSYLEGFRSGVYLQINRAEQDARERQAAKDQEAKDLAMLEGRKSEVTYALVLVDRRKAVDVAMDLAYGITQEQRARWAAEYETNRPAREAEHARKMQERADCKRCKNAKSGQCKEHRVSYGRSRPSYERKGSRWSDGYEDGQRADLGLGTAIQDDGPLEIG
jgi:hypothetical protein